MVWWALHKMMGTTWKTMAKVLAIGVLVNAAMLSLSFGLKAALEPADDANAVTGDDREGDEINAIIVYNVTFRILNYYVFDIQRTYESQNRDADALTSAETLNLSLVTGNNEPDVFPPYPYVNSTVDLPPNVVIHPTVIFYHVNITLFNATFNVTTQQFGLKCSPNPNGPYPVWVLDLFVLVNGTWIDPGSTNATFTPFLGWWVEVVYSYQPPGCCILGYSTCISIGLDPNMCPCFVARSRLSYY